VMGSFTSDSAGLGESPVMGSWTSDSAGLGENPVMGSCTSGHGNEHQYYVTNERKHISTNTLYHILQFTDMLGHFCGHLQRVVKEQKQ
jgi:hypothetical protein